MVFQQLQFSTVLQGINGLLIGGVLMPNWLLWKPSINGLLIGGVLLPDWLLWKPSINAPEQVNPCRFQSYGTQCVDR